MEKRSVLLFCVTALCLSCMENPEASIDGYTSNVCYSFVVDASATSDTVQVAVIPSCYANASWRYNPDYASDILISSFGENRKAALALNRFYNSLDVVMSSFILKVVVGASVYYFAGWPLDGYPNSGYAFESIDALGCVDQIHTANMLHPVISTGLTPLASTLLDDYDMPSATYSVTIRSDDSVSIVLQNLRTYP